MIEIAPLTPALEDAYSAFVRSRPDGLLYHSLAYRDLLAEHLDARPEYLVALDGGEVRGVLPLMWAERDGAVVANSLPYYGSHGSALAAGATEREALLAAWAERATDPRTASATLVENPFTAEPISAPPHDLTDERINQATALPAEGIDSSARRNLRKAQRLGTEVAREPEALAALCSIHQANMADIGGRAKRADFFRAVGRHFRPGDEYDVYTARIDGGVVAALLLFWFGEVAEYFTPAVDHDHRPNQPLAAILDTALTDAHARGLRWFNWGGTWNSQDGVYRFKHKWGARDARYRYFVKVNDRALLDLSAHELRERFGDFYVVPFSALEPKGVSS
jgi:hypothetical protein